jgi:hypothetical protein
MTGLPVVFTSGEQKVLDAYQKETGENNLLPLVIRTRPDWMDGTV